MDLIFVRPREGLAIRMPDGAPLPAEGAEVEPGLYWQRRIADGDVLVAAAEGASDPMSGRPHATKKKEA